MCGVILILIRAACVILSLSLVFEPQYLRHNGKGNAPLELVTMFYLNVISLGDVIR